MCHGHYKFTEVTEQQLLKSNVTLHQYYSQGKEYNRVIRHTPSAFRNIMNIIDIP